MAPFFFYKPGLNISRVFNISLTFK